MDKTKLRKEILAIRGLLNQEEVIKYSIDVERKIFSLKNYDKSEEILIYVSYNNEINTINLIGNAFANNKKVAVPKVHKDGEMDFYYISSLDDLVKGYMGILEPDADLCKCVDVNKRFDKSLMICPLVAFDSRCNRIGYGGGYYDRYLSKVKISTVALAYDFQKVDDIKVEEFDEKIDMIITPKNTYYKN